MSLITQLNALFIDQLNIEVPGPDADLIETGMLDSMKLVELLVQIEQQFGLRIELENIEIDDLRTVRGIARMIANAAPDAPATAAPPALGPAVPLAIGAAAPASIAAAVAVEIEEAAPLAAAG